MKIKFRNKLKSQINKNKKHYKKTPNKKTKKVTNRKYKNCIIKLNLLKFK
jgi:hypothetical protein